MSDKPHYITFERLEAEFTVIQLRSLVAHAVVYKQVSFDETAKMILETSKKIGTLFGLGDDVDEANRKSDAVMRMWVEKHSNFRYRVGTLIEAFVDLEMLKPLPEIPSAFAQHIIDESQFVLVRKPEFAGDILNSKIVEILKEEALSMIRSRQCDIPGAIVKIEELFQ